MSENRFSAMYGVTLTELEFSSGAGADIPQSSKQRTATGRGPVHRTSDASAGSDAENRSLNPAFLAALATL